MSDEKKIVTARVDADQLTWRESVFAHAYLANGGNGKQAALAAGYKGDLSRRASMLLKKPEIAAVIKRERAKRLSELDATAERVLRHLVFIAFADPRKLFNPDGNSLRPVTQLDQATAGAIASLDFRRTNKKGMVSRLRFWSKPNALQLLGEYLNMWKGAGNHDDEDRLDEVIDAIRGVGKPRKEKNDDRDDD